MWIMHGCLFTHKSAHYYFALDYPTFFACQLGYAERCPGIHFLFPCPICTYWVDHF